jgi:hypothetical protein
MNDLINELKNDAVDWAMDNLDPDLNDFEWEKAIDKKFAELMVRECVGIADEYDGVGSTIVSRIKKHFGVEE